MPFFYTDSGSFNTLEVTGSTILSGSLIISGTAQFGSGGLTGSLFGTSSWASNAVSSSFATTASAANSITFTPSSASFATTASAANSITFTPTTASFSTTASFATTASAATSITFIPTSASFASTSSFVNALTTLTASNVQLNSLTDTTATNKVLVLDTATNKIFTTASVGTGGGGSGTGFPFSGSGVITGSLLISSSATGLALAITGSTNISGGVTSSLGFFGTSSFAVSSSIAASASYVASASFGGYINFPSGLVVTGSITASAVSASFITSSHVQLNGLSDTTSANKVLVLDTTTNKIFTTASVGGGGSGTGFPFSGSAVISGSLIVSSSNNNSPVIISGSTDSFFELEVINFSAGNNASTDIIASSNDTTDSGNYIDLGINSTTYNAGLVGGPSDGYVYFTSSVGELDIGNASPGSNGNVRLFAGGPNSAAATRIFISSSGNVGIGVTSSLQNRLTVVGGISASLVTSSQVQLIDVTDTTATNKVLVLDTATNKIFTTASILPTGLISSSRQFNTFTTPFTGSFTGSFSGSLDRFNPAALRITVGTTAPASPAVNDLWVDTN